MALKRKGILLAGGTNSRLFPATLAVPKSLLPVYDKPLIYYSLSTLMLSDITDILIITTPEHLELHRRLLGDGKQWGMQFSYQSQSQPRGIAEALIIGGDFCGTAPIALALSDNIYHVTGLGALLRTASATTHGAAVFAYSVADPERFGVVTFDAAGNANSLEEKPRAPQSSFAVTGLYFYDSDAVVIASELSPSARGELEITDINREYLRRGTLRVHTFGRGATWFDTGTPESLATAADFVRAVQKRQNMMIASPEEIAWRNHWITRRELLHCADLLGKVPYANYLRDVADAAANPPSAQ